MTLATTPPFEIKASLASSRVAGSVLYLGITQDGNIPNPGTTLCHGSHKQHCLTDPESYGALLSSFIPSPLFLGSSKSAVVRS